MKKYFAYIDESGNADLDVSKDGASNYFVITAIIADEESLNLLKSHVSHLRKIHFQTGEIKSSKIGSDDKRRIKILTDIFDFPFHIYTLIVDKQKICSKGLIYKDSFHKFIPGILYTDLKRSFDDLHIVVDEHGSREFSQSLIKYVGYDEGPQTSLFENRFQVADSKAEELVQLADLISGTFARSLEIGRSSQNATIFRGLLGTKIISLKEWPPEHESLIVDTANIPANKVRDQQISNLALGHANGYIEEMSQTKEPKVKYQVSCREYLIYVFRYDNRSSYVSTRRLLEQVKSCHDRDLPLQFFRTKVIGALRDKGILIVSCNKGYKLPENEKDLCDFINHDNMIIAPMLNRIKKCRDQVLLATTNEVDIIDRPEYKALKPFFYDIDRR